MELMGKTILSYWRRYKVHQYNHLSTPLAMGQSFPINHGNYLTTSDIPKPPRVRSYIPILVHLHYSSLTRVCFLYSALRLRFITFAAGKHVGKAGVAGSSSICGLMKAGKAAAWRNALYAQAATSSALLDQQKTWCRQRMSPLSVPRISRIVYISCFPMTIITVVT